MTFKIIFELAMLVIEKEVFPSVPGTYQVYKLGSLMERVHLYFLGPLPRTERGNEYILVMVTS